MSTTPRNEDLFLDVPDFEGDRDPLDRYYTPEWVTMALLNQFAWMLSEPIWEPCAGAGHILDVLKRGGGHVIGSDVEPQRDDISESDFLSSDTDHPSVDWIITNPPYRTPDGHKPSDFVRRALDAARKGVAMLLWQSFLEGCSDRLDLHQTRPPSHILWLPRFNFIVPGRKDDGPSMMGGWFVWNLRYLDGATRMYWAGPEVRP